MAGADVILILFVQIALIVALARILGWLFGLLRQPQVMGEMLAGILLGPSLLGWLAPDAYAALFPTGSVSLIKVLSHVGVVFFLFLIGLDLDPTLLRKRGKAAVGISIASIAIPFFMGAGLTALLPARFFAGEHSVAALLFMGAAMSITAFPVLARILTERNLHRSHVGVLSIAAAAVNDVAAWCILAFVVAVAQFQGLAGGVRTALLAGTYVAVMFLAVKPLLRRLELVYERQGRLSQNVVAIIFLLILASAFATDWIGIHALFGAFLLGFVMPKGTHFVRHLSEKLEDFTVVFLLPLFFAYAGLRTQINLLNSPEMWLYAGLIILVACAGKFGGSFAAARAFGTPWREASAIGILMNTRGLMELVILTVGRELNVIGDEVFAMMVLMAIVTTAMTAPLLHWVYPTRLVQPAKPERRAAFSILIPVSLPKTGAALARLAELLIGPDRPASRIIALHLRRPADHEVYRSGLDDQSEPQNPVLAPLLEEASARKLPIEPLSFMSRDVAEGISAVAAARQMDLVLMGYHKPVIGSRLLGGTVHSILTVCPSPVAVFIDRGLTTPQRILVPYMGGPHDRLAMELAQRLARHARAQVTVLHITSSLRSRSLGAKSDVERVFADPAVAGQVTFRTVEDDSPADVVIRASCDFDLVIVGMTEEWGLESHWFGWRPERIAQKCPVSLLVVHRQPSAAPTPSPGVDIATGQASLPAPP